MCSARPTRYTVLFQERGERLMETLPGWTPRPLGQGLPAPSLSPPVSSLPQGTSRRQESSSVPISPSHPPPPPTLLGGALWGLVGLHRLELSFLCFE